MSGGGDVEFLAAGDSADDAAAPDGAAHRPGRPGPPSRWWIGGLAAVIAALVGFAVTRPSHPTPRATGTPSAAPTPTRTGPLGTAPVLPAAERPCHGAPFCSASVQVPPDVRTALRHAFPRVRALDVRTLFAQSATNGSLYLAERDITALVGPARLLVRVQRRYDLPPTLPAEATPEPGERVVDLHVVSVGYVVDVRYRTPAGVPLRRRALQVLGADDRLETP